jgi:hypothetical protein
MAWFSKKKISFWTENACFDFFCNIWPKYFPFKKNWAKYYHKFTHIFMQITLHSCEILLNLEFSPRFLKEAQTSCMKINLVAAELHAVWKTDRRTDRQTGRQKSLGN